MRTPAIIAAGDTTIGQLAALYARSDLVLGPDSGPLHLAVAVGTLQAFFPFWSTFLWGGIGGAIGALYSLWWHVAEEQDFDRQYSLWYIAQPIMGVVLGGIIYLLISAGFLVLQVVPVNQQNSMGHWLGPALIACIAGFRQNFVYDLFNRIIATFSPKDEVEAQSE